MKLNLYADIRKPINLICDTCCRELFIDRVTDDGLVYVHCQACRDRHEKTDRTLKSIYQAEKMKGEVQ